MLRIENLKKTYKNGNLITTAIDNTSIVFRKSEFVCILGPSGCGKTTILNVLGALDKPDSGDILINNNSLFRLNDVNLDRYRNNVVGFIFQKHNLINQLNLLENIEIKIALTGMDSNICRNRAFELLDMVGLKDHAYKKPTQISVGQSQRVAIARALSNDPDIILADEPTGSVDSATATEILDLIKEISKDKLVILVTHNKIIAHKYASRIINLRDGKVISDSNPYNENIDINDKLTFKKTFMPFFASLKIAFNNIKTKLGRALLMILASSIALLGISFVLALSRGVNNEVANYQEKILSNFPIEITYDSVYIDRLESSYVNYLPNIDYLIAQEIRRKKMVTDFNINNITNQYAEYIKDYYDNNKEQFSGLVIAPRMKFTILRPFINSKNKVDYKVYFTSLGECDNLYAFTMLALTQIPEGDIFYNLHDLVDGKKPETVNDINNKTFGILLFVDDFNQIHASTLHALGISTQNQEAPDPASLIGQELLLNPGTYIIENFNPDEAIKLKITGVIKAKPDNPFLIMDKGFAFTDDLVDYLKANHPNSIGEPNYIRIYPKNFASRELIINHLDLYNEQFGPNDTENIIEYSDRASAVIDNSTSNFINSVSSGLLLFSSINLVIASIMILTITYTNVVERTKEIGLLRAIGARKKDISRIFNSENILVGFISGIIATIISHTLTYPANVIFKKYTDFNKMLQVSYYDTIIILILGLVIAFIAGYIPAKIAAKRDPVKALRVE